MALGMGTRGMLLEVVGRAKGSSRTAEKGATEVSPNEKDVD